MKASRKESNVFIPVCLTLESQAEVDAIYAVLNHGRLCDSLGFDAEYKQLEPFKSDESEEFHTKINNVFKK